MQNLTGQTIKGYQIRDLIGIGGFGQVYRAYQSILDREVAIKVILAQYANNPEFIRNFEIEAQYIARLEHLHIVPLYDFWREPSAAYIVMRMLKGGSLQSWVKADGGLKLDDAARVLDQIASALYLAHINGIVHQDIKPANILLDDDRNAYLSDFGIAVDTKQAKPADIKENFDKPLHGSPEYMAPEQILRAGNDFRSDIYSLGIVLFEMLTGHKPFEASNDDELIRIQVNERLPRLQDFRPELPEILNVVIQRSTDKNPRNRYPTALKMAENFRELLNATNAKTAEEVPNVAQATPVKPAAPTLEDLLYDPPNPYKGLRAFKEGDAQDFFGREAQIERLFQRIRATGAGALNGNRFIAVVGASGSGKSSLVRAGLLPQLRKHSFDWFITEMTPGLSPIKALSAALMKAAPDDSIQVEKMLRTRRDGLTRAVNSVLDDFLSEMVLFIDQFEELFTMVEDRDEINQFLDLIVQAVMAEESRIRIIITLRADFYDRPLGHPTFGKLFMERVETLLPMDEDGLRLAITKPAERVGLKLEPGLVEQVINDASDQPGILPLLQFALSELYTNRRGQTLTLAGYKTSGGVSGAIARTAEEIHYRLSAESKRLARQVFLRLVTLGEGTEDTRRRVLMSELLAISSDERLVRQMLDVFGERRLLSFDSDPATRTPTVEIAHEALIKRWQILQEWLNDNRDDLRLHRKLIRAAGEWENASREPSYLVEGARLTELEPLLKHPQIVLNQNERDYLNASIQQRDRQARLRKVYIGVLTLLTVTSAILALFAINGENQARSARDQAQSRELAVRAMNNLETDYDLAALLGVQAFNTADTFVARESLFTVLQAQRSQLGYLGTYLRNTGGDTRTVAISPDGKTVAVGGEGGLQLWSVEGWQPLGDPLLLDGIALNEVVFSPDGQTVVGVYADGIARAWNVATGMFQPLTQQAGQGNALWGVAFHPAGNVIAAVDQGGTAHLWTFPDGEHRSVKVSDSTLSLVAFAPDGESFVAAGADSLIYRLSVSTLEIIGTPFSADSWVRSLAFNPSGALLASGNSTGQVMVWSMGTGQRVGEPFLNHSERSGVHGLTFAFGGSVIVSSADDGSVLVRRLNGEIVDTFNPPTNNLLREVAITPDNRYLVIGVREYPSAFVWDFTRRSRLGAALNVLETQDMSQAVAFTDDGHFISLHADFGRPSPITISSWGDLFAQASPVLRVERAVFGALAAVELSVSGHRALIPAEQGRVFVYDTGTGENIEVVTAPLRTQGIFSIAYSQDEQHIALGYDNGTLIILHHTGENEWETLLNLPDAHPDRIIALGFSADGRRIATGGRDNVVRVWDATNAEQVGGDLTLHTAQPLVVRFNPANPQGEQLVTAGRDNQVIFWDLTTDPATGLALVGHNGWVTDIAFTSDGQWLASGDSAGTVLLWNMANTLPRRINIPLEQSAGVNALRFSPDDRSLLVGTNESVNLWSLAVTDWLEMACNIANRALTTTEWALFMPDMAYNASCRP